GYYGSGNQEYENAVNNFTVFGYMGLGALLAQATQINKSMTVAAAWGIHHVAKNSPQYGKNHLIPDATNMDLLVEEAQSIALAAVRSGVSQRAPATLTGYELMDVIKKDIPRDIQ